MTDGRVARRALGERERVERRESGDIGDRLW
jgi:hypothetical protein